MSELSLDEFNTLERRYEAGCASRSDLEALEPYRAKRAVLLASGFGSRMLPITLNTPKPLVNVGGRSIISTLLDALISIDIKEIYIVTGYLGEQFELLKRVYPTITLLENPLYDRTNNISSACVAKDCFRNAYAFESDLFLTNPSIIKKYRYHTCYFGVPVQKTLDWCFETENGVITGLHKGGTNCHHMFGISYWSFEDGANLEHDLQECFDENDDNKQRFWDDVPCILRRENYRIHIEECSPGDVTEIDSYQELCQIDPRYVVRQRNEAVV